MDINDLKIFQTTARTQSTTQASKLLYMTPQGISKVIKKLEAELDCTLFARTSAGMKLTESGERFLAYADRAVDEYNKTNSDLLHIEQRHRMTVDLLSAYGILRFVTPACILAFCERYPDVSLHYREYPDLVVDRLFNENEGNVAFSIKGYSDEAYDALYHVTPLFSFPIRLMVHESHPFSKKETVSIRDLEQQPLYIESSQFHIHHKIVDACRSAGFEPNIVFETSGFSLCHKMVRENRGISVTVDFISDDMSQSGIRLIPFDNNDLAWNALMLTRRSESSNPAVRLFSSHVLGCVQRLQQGEYTR